MKPPPRRLLPGIALLGAALLATPIAHGTVSPPDSAPDSGEVKPADFAYVAATGKDRIGRVMAPVFVNGVGPFAFIVDTGASSSVIAPQLVERLGLVADPRPTRKLRGITGSEDVSTVAVERLVAGKIELTARDLPIVEPRVFADADGILGADAFARGCLHLDFGLQRIAILQSACPRVEPEWEITPVQLRFGGLPVARGRIGTVRVAVIIDTGAQRSLGNLSLLEALDLQGEAKDPAAITEVLSASTLSAPGSIINAPPIRIGGFQIGDLRPVFGDFEVFQLWGFHDVPAILLGMDVLGTAQELMLDYRRSRLLIRTQHPAGTVQRRLNVSPSRLLR